MKVSSFSKRCPTGFTVPPALAALFDYAARNGGTAATLELGEDYDDDVVAWFHGDEAAAAQFAPFGHDGVGGLYTLWFREGCDPLKAPVVYLDGNRDAAFIVASDVLSFLGLLALSHRIPAKPHTAVVRGDGGVFRQWAVATLGVELPADPVALVDEAGTAHPDPEALVQPWAAKRVA